MICFPMSALERYYKSFLVTFMLHVRREKEKKAAIFINSEVQLQPNGRLKSSWAIRVLNS